jgi:hypothetical protein
MFLRSHKSGEARFVSAKAAVVTYLLLALVLAVGVVLLSVSHGYAHHFTLFLIGLLLTMLSATLMTSFFFLLVGESEERDRLRDLRR